MALAFYFSPTAVMTAPQYDECIVRLKKAGAGHPPGRVYHAAFGTNDRVEVFDVWTSQASFEKFGQTLMPILHALGVDPGQPRVAEVHNVIIPPKKAAKPAASKRPAAKPAAKGKARRKGKKR